jgi:hypothetical protein
MPAKQSNTQVANAIKERNRLYLAVFRELSKPYGEDEAKSVMRSVSHELGTAVGQDNGAPWSARLFGYT